MATVETEREKAEKPRTRRIDTLSLPKPIPNGFIDDRRSLYWGRHDTIVKDWDSGNVATTFAISQRLQSLIEPKKIHSQYAGDRPSPIWVVSKAAQGAACSGRVETLAEAKTVHRDFRPEKSVYTTVSDAAKNCGANQRIETLANPKRYRQLPIKPDSNWDWGEWDSEIPEAAKRGVSRSCIAIKSADQAKNALPSLRVQQLARPKSRSQYKEDYDQNWYKVSPSAKMAHANTRLVELCAPIPRKVRQKRVAVPTE
eukprot:gene11767-12984_t